MIKNIPFLQGNLYSRKDIYKILDVPSQKQNGSWNTGYTPYNGNYYIFCNIGDKGRTGHDYANFFDGTNLIWYGKTNSHLQQPTVQNLLNPNVNVFIFSRYSNKNVQFTFLGIGRVKEVYDESPVKIIWTFNDELSPVEISNPEYYAEGTKRQITVNAYERNPIARQKCLEHYGYNCMVCHFNFYDTYGEIGKDFIHVHHEKPLHEIGENYEVHPINDLKPVCPNCHAMIHRQKPAYSIEEIKELLKIKKE